MKGRGAWCVLTEKSPTVSAGPSSGDHMMDWKEPKQYRSRRCQVTEYPKTKTLISDSTDLYSPWKQCVFHMKAADPWTIKKEGHLQQWARLVGRNAARERRPRNKNSLCGLITHNKVFMLFCPSLVLTLIMCCISASSAAATISPFMGNSWEIWTPQFSIGFLP